MDPISIAVEFEIGSFLLGVAGLVATWLHHRGQQVHYEQKERHHRENLVASGHADAVEQPMLITTVPIPQK